MKGFLAMIAVAATVAAVSASSVLAKGHVPDNKDQVCHRGTVLTVGSSAVDGHLRHGDSFIDKNSTTFFTGDDCDVE